MAHARAHSALALKSNGTKMGGLMKLLRRADALSAGARQLAAAAVAARPPPEADGTIAACSISGMEGRSECPTRKAS